MLAGNLNKNKITHLPKSVFSFEQHSLTNVILPKNANQQFFGFLLNGFFGMLNLREISENWVFPSFKSRHLRNEMLIY